ncbi:hypothetical protein FHD02_20225 [Citrobacter sp. EC_71]|uniref:hypothetical protein n=1 Tax=Citrobacter sp. EC_71 TaxID=2584093 RepID=UPI001C702975|nr:hypothetical protein [Citrobacter sp. EC_71]MBW9353904.1 hypothetical protein [Citrobacter sp. EC_71]
MKNTYSNANTLSYDFNVDFALDKQFIRHNFNRGELRINRETGGIILVIRWEYIWIKRWDAKNDWTNTEKDMFHANVNAIISQVWNDKISFSVSGKSDFAKKFRGKKLPFNIQIIQVERNEHWRVYTYKIDNSNPDSFFRSSVSWKSGHIYIDSKDNVMETKYLDSSNISRKQKGLAHELGHVIGYLVDEYQTGNSDPSALMSIGMELRPRYLTAVVENLNKMIYDTNFQIKDVIK